MSSSILMRLVSVILPHDEEHITNRRLSKGLHNLDTCEGLFLKTSVRRNSCRWSDNGALLQSYEFNLDDDDDNDSAETGGSKAIQITHAAESSEPGVPLAELSASAVAAVSRVHGSVSENACAETVSLTAASDSEQEEEGRRQSIQARPRNSILKRETGEESEQFACQSENNITGAVAGGGSSTTRRIRFRSTVIMHMHTIILGDNPAVSSGPPLTIEWKAFQSVEVPLKTEKDATHSSRVFTKGKKSAPKLSSIDRQKILHASGVTYVEIKAAMDQVKAIQLTRMTIVRTVQRQEAAASKKASKSSKTATTIRATKRTTSRHRIPKWMQFFSRKHVREQQPVVTIIRPR